MPFDAIAGLFGGGIDAAVSAKMAADNRKFQERMTRHRYQYQMQDMQAAGLNPMLSFMQSPGAAPGGAMPSMQSPATSGIAAATQLAQQALLDKQADKEESVTGLNTAVTRLRTAEAVKAELEAKAYGVPSTAWDWLFKPQNWKAPQLTPAQQQKRRQDAWQYQNQGVPHSGKSGKRQRTHRLDWDHWMEEFNQEQRKQQPDYMEGWDDYTEKMRGRW